MGHIRYTNEWISEWVLGAKGLRGRGNVAGESTLDSGAGKTSLKDGMKVGIRGSGVKSQVEGGTQSSRHRTPKGREAR